jgi:hypothetical protein
MTSQDSHSFQSPLVRRKTPDVAHPVTGEGDEEENNILPAWVPLRMTMQTPQSRRFSTDHRDGRSRFGAAAPGTAATAVKTGFKARLEEKRHKEEDWILPFERALNVEGRLATTSMKTSVETERMSYKSKFNRAATPPLESLTDLMDTMSLGKDAGEEDAAKGTPSHNILRWSPSLPSGRRTLARQSTKFTKETLPGSIESGRSHRWTNAHDVIISLRHNLPEAPVPIPSRTGACLWSPADILSTPDKLKSSRQAKVTPPAQSFQELKALRQETEAYLTQSQVQGGPRVSAERTFREQRLPLVKGAEEKLPQPTLPPLAPKREVVVEERFARLKALRHQANQVFS